MTSAATARKGSDDVHPSIPRGCTSTLARSLGFAPAPAYKYPALLSYNWCLYQGYFWVCRRAQVSRPCDADSALCVTHASKKGSFVPKHTFQLSV
eukprot:3287995-Pleurochrysis_carterae.AAC.1